MVTVSELMPYVPPVGEVYFPLASNAHALVAGGPIGSVRARMKVSSLLYNRVLLEAGQIVIQAGPQGASVFRHGPRPDSPASWQTPRGPQPGSGRAIRGVRSSGDHARRGRSWPIPSCAPLSDVDLLAAYLRALPEGASSRV